MIKTDCGQIVYDQEQDILNLFMIDPHFSSVIVTEDLYLPDNPQFVKYQPRDCETFHKENQQNWKMPEYYKNLDIADFVLKQCESELALQRCAEELLVYQKHDMFDLLRYLKYLVDTMRENNIVFGVGRGSSVASYVLYKIGVHRINSLKYELDFSEFLE